MRQLLARNRFLLAFSLLSSIMGTSVGVAKVTTSLYAVRLGAHEALLGLIAGSQSIGVLIMSLPLGLMVERHGPARVFTLGTLVAGGLYVILPLVASADFLLACTTAIGFFMPFRFVALNTVFLEQLLSLGDAKAGWYRGTHMAGMFLIGPMLAAGMVERFSFAGTYQWIAAAFALTILLSPIVFGPYAARQAAVGPLRWRDVSARLALVGRDPELRRACIVECAAQSINAFYTFFIVVIAVTSLGLAKADAAGLVAAQGFSYVFSLIALGGLATRLGPGRVAVTSCTLIVVALLALGTGRQIPALWLGGMLLGLGLGLLQIMNLMSFARIGARIGRGSVAGVNALVGPAGSFAGSLLGGALGRSLGLQSVFLVFVPMVVVLGWQLGQPVQEVALEA
jgi:MFS family permease